MQNMSVRPIGAAALTAAVLLMPLALTHPAAADEDPYVLTIKDHRFDPETLEVPAGKRVKLVVRNQDPTAEEFESYSLNREKVIAGGSEGIVYIGPLDPGTYEFFGEFHEDTAKGKLIAK